MNFKNFACICIASMVFTACLNEGNNNNDSSSSSTTSTQKDPEDVNVIIDSANFTTIAWIDSTKDVSKVIEGQKVEVVFRFKNTGNKPLIIQNAQPSCGCTVPEKPEKPIMPGEESMIKAVFDSQGRPGRNEKTITVLTNTKPTTNHLLRFSVEVAGKETGSKSLQQTSKGNSF